MLFLNCKQAVLLQSEGIERELPFFQRLGLRLHLLVCKWCRRYQRQVSFLRGNEAHSSEPMRMASSGPLSAEARERIKRVLEAARK